MAAEPPGNMVLKIHLPRRGSDKAPETHQAGARPERGGVMSRWFRHVKSYPRGFAPSDSPEHALLARRSRRRAPIAWLTRYARSRH